MSTIARKPEKNIETKVFEKRYRFLTGRHSGSFFLKIGAAIFCIGHIIHNVVIFTKNVIAFSRDIPYNGTGPKYGE